MLTLITENILFIGRKPYSLSQEVAREISSKSETQRKILHIDFPEDKLSTKQKQLKFGEVN